MKIETKTTEVEYGSNDYSDTIKPFIRCKSK